MRDQKHTDEAGPPQSVHTQATTIPDLVHEMRRLSAEIEPQRRVFHDTYLRTTEAVDEARSKGWFVDPEWVERWDLAFAGMYLDALETDREGGLPSRPWQVAFAAADGPRLPPLRLVLLGMNAHINYDLPRAICEVISDEEWDDPALLARRAIDHHRMDELLAARVAAEDRNLEAIEMPGDRTLLDRILQPLNRLGTKRFLAESRAKVWRNAEILARARRSGRGSAALSDLERLAANRVQDLTRPGQVILELAARGFGVSLEEL